MKSSFIAACVISATLWAAPAVAQESLTTKFSIDDADPESSVPTHDEAMKAPLQMGYWVMMITERADAAEKKGELDAAARYYRALTKGVPDRRIAFARLCRVYEKMTDWLRAAESCKAALARQGAKAEDAVRFVHVVLAEGSQLKPAQLAEVDEVISHLEAESTKAAAKREAGDPDSPSEVDLLEQRRAQAQLRCEVATYLQDERRLEQCTGALAKLAPGDPATLSFSFALALLRGDFERAKMLIGQGDQARLPTLAIERMKSRLVAERERQSLVGRVKALRWQLERNPAWLAYLGILLLAAGAAMLFVRRDPAAAR